MKNRKIDGKIPDTQECNKCLKYKSSDEFSKREYKSKPFLNKTCKKCVCERVKKYKEDNREKVLQSKRESWHRNKGKILEIHNERSRQYFKNNPEKRRATAREWARRNRSKIKEYRQQRYYSDPEFNMQIKIRRRIYMALFRKRGIKQNKMVDLLGCTPSFFKSYIEGLFTEGMTWDGILKSEIHLDHKIPCSKFNLLDPIEQVKCFHYTNMQPLWAEDNLYKHCKIE